MNINETIAKFLDEWYDLANGEITEYIAGEMYARVKLARSLNWPIPGEGVAFSTQRRIR